MMASFSAAFLRREPAAARFFPGDFRDADAWRSTLANVARRPLPVAPAMWHELAAQQTALPPSPARTRNLEALQQPGTVVVVTGQQLGLFLGPLYTFYKAATAIQLARNVEKQHGVRCVPIFWLQTEDHDFDEIRDCHLPVFSSDGDLDGLTLSLDRDGDPDRSRQSVAHRKLGPEVEGLLTTLRESLTGAPHAAACVDLFAAHYRAGAALSTAFAGVVASLFSDEGLLIVDPRQPGLAPHAAPIHRVAIEQQADLAHALLQHGQDLQRAGFSEQVAVRPGSSLFFFHESADGPRFRLDRIDGSDTWLLPRRENGSARSLSTADLLATLQRDPLCFSTSALLRPLLQDWLFPTVAYVGGPGEINYWAQLLPLYTRFAQHLPIHQPLVVPRARFRCVDSTTRSLLQKLQLTTGDVERPRDEALSRAMRQQAGQRSDDPNLTAHALDLAASADALRQQLLSDVDARLLQLGDREPGLRDAVRRTRLSVERNIDRLLNRYQRLGRERDATLCQRIDRLQRVLYPHGAPQERHYSLPYFLAKYGAQAFKEQVFASLQRHDFQQIAVADLDL